MTAKKKLLIGTRSSALALVQANWVKGQLEKKYSDLSVDLVKIKTKGDKILDVPLAKVGGKGLFVKEIEEALLEGKVDIAVHSVKDMPVELPDPLQLTALTKRADPRDALISKNNLKLKDLGRGARMGTSSLRRQSQLLHHRPDLNIVSLRGNLGTRIKKLDTENLDAIILASAGLIRMGMPIKITEYLSPDILLPAIGQGALGIETKKGKEQINRMVSFLNHQETFITVSAERSFLKKLQGGCQVPIAAFGESRDNRLICRGLVGSVDGKRMVSDKVTGDLNNFENLGIELAEKLLGQGAGEILEEVYTI